MKKRYLLFCSSIILILTNCKTNNDVVINNTKSIADDIAGLYSGTGKNMPNGISLGTYSGCVTPIGWENNLKTGASFVNISKVNDSIVNITFSGGPFSNNTFSNIKIIKSGDRIKIGSGYSDVSSRFLSISFSNDLWIATNACLQGLPNYWGWSVLGDNKYFYQTHGYCDFSGIKQ